MKNKIHYLILLLGLILLGFLTNFMATRHENKKVNLLNIHLQGFKKDSLLNKKDIKKILIKSQKKISLEDQKISEISVSEIEKMLQSHPFIKRSEVFFSPNGSLNINIWQHRPLARIKNQTKEYYLGSEAQMINLSPENTAKVILVSGDFSKKEHESLKEIIELIEEDSLLKEELIGIKKIISEEFKLILQLRNHLVILGTVDNFREKLINLKEFYEQYLTKTDIIEYYKVIDLQYKDQIVATKRKK